MSNEKEKQLLLFCQKSEFVEVLQKVQDETGEDIIGDLILLNELLKNQDTIAKVCQKLDDVLTKNQETLKLYKTDGIVKELLESENKQAIDILERIHYTITLYHIEKQEMLKIKERRNKINGGEENASKYRNDGSFALALSGGGVRSSTFNLGLLQALERCHILKDIDYLSTVSGGGYIGSSLTWFMSRDGKFPFGTTRTDNNQESGNRVSWLRDHGSYLAPGDGLSIWSFFASLLSAMFKNIAIIFLFFISIFMILTISFASYMGMIIALSMFVGLMVLTWKVLPLKILQNKKILYIFASIILFLWVFYDFLSPLDQANGFTFILATGYFYMMLLVLYTLFEIKSTYSFINERNWKVIQGDLLMYGSFFILLGLLTYTYGFQYSEEGRDFEELYAALISGRDFKELYAALISGSSGLVIILGALKKFTNNRYKSVLLFTGVNLLVVGLIWVFYILAIYLSAILYYHLIIILEFYLVNYEFYLGNYYSDAAVIIIAVTAVIVLFLLYRYMDLMDVNYTSMHRFYKNRLKEAFMPGTDDTDISKSYLCNLDTLQSPYHIINTTVNTSNSKKVKLKGRGGDNFIFSPLVSGSNVTGYIETKKYEGGTIDLATAMTVSGAAVSPHTSIVRSKAISFLLTLFNIRLGYWIQNPSFFGKKNKFDSAGFYHFSMLFRELFGKALDETKKYLLLTDGGHFENLALYELVRRKCRYIIVSDAGADPDRTFGDLGSVIEKVRVDFGAKIDINTMPMHPKGKKHLSNQAFVHGTIEYKDGTLADLIYINTVMIRELPEDLYTYAKTNPQFPDESTSDQFFDEKQFEAYRELGYQIGYKMCQEMSHADFRQIFNIK